MLGQPDEQKNIKMSALLSFSCNSFSPVRVKLNLEPFPEYEVGKDKIK